MDERFVCGRSRVTTTGIRLHEERRQADMSDVNLMCTEPLLPFKREKPPG